MQMKARNSMDYIELEKLYKFSIDNDIDVTKHGVKIPSVEAVEKLRDEHKITGDMQKYIQVLDDGKTVSFVLRIGSNFTLFESVCSRADEYKVEPYDESEDE